MTTWHVHLCSTFGAIAPSSFTKKLLRNGFLVDFCPKNALKLDFSQFFVIASTLYLSNLKYFYMGIVSEPRRHFWCNIVKINNQEVTWNWIRIHIFAQKMLLKIGFFSVFFVGMGLRFVKTQHFLYQNVRLDEAHLLFAIWLINSNVFGAKTKPKGTHLRKTGFFMFTTALLWLGLRC